MRSRIVGRNLTPLLDERFDQENRRGFADVVGTALEGQPQHTQFLAAQGPKRAANLADEALALFFVDANDFIEQAEIVAALAGHGAEGRQIFRKAGAAVADARVQETGTDASVGADPLTDLLHVGAYT